MAQTANTLDRDQSARRRAAVSQSVKGRDSRTQQRSRFGIAECVGYRRQRFDGSDHVLLVSTVVADACNFRVTAVQEASSPAFGTRVVLPAMPTDADTLSLLPSGDLGAQFIDDACDFVPRDPRILNSGPEAVFHEYVAVANPTSLHLDEHLSRTRLGNFTLDNLEISPRFGNLRHLHRCCRDLCTCHDASC